MDKYSLPQKIFYGLVLALAVLQFFQIDKTNPVTDPDLDFLNIVETPDEVATILKTACYDCHSNQTVYPWYTNLQPVGWWVQDHVNHSKEYLDFSLWGEYSADRADHKMEEIVEYTLNGEMPLRSYTWMHPESRLTEEQREMFATWFEEQRLITKIDTSTTIESDN